MTSLRPFLICALAVFFGTVLDALVKAIAMDLDVLTLTAWRFLFGAVMILSAYCARGGGMPTIPAMRFHAMRGSVHAVAVLSFFGALSLLPLAMATVLGFMAALMVAPIARVILGEPLNGIAIGAAGIGFVGAALTASGFESADLEAETRLLGVALAMIAAVAYAATLVLIRLRARTENALTIVMFSNVVPAIIIWTILLGASLAEGGPAIWPGLEAMPLLVMLAVLGVTVWLLMTYAYGNAPAGQLAPLEYTALIWSGLFGAVFFAEYPGWRLYVGAAIIIGACLLVALEDKFRTRQKAGLPASDILD
ncbi:MAG: DMT family transporter [Pseudomonadota bacterium]